MRTEIQRLKWKNFPISFRKQPYLWEYFFLLMFLLLLLYVCVVISLTDNKSHEWATSEQ